MPAPIPNPPALSPHTNDERTWAALAHGSALLNFIGGFGGIIAALLIWLTQKEKSAWAAFHGLQSLVFQAAILIITVIVVGVVWTVGFAISFLTVGFGALVAVPFMILVFFGGFAVMGAGVIYALYGAYQVYNDREFHYLWIGDWIERRSSGK